MKIYGAGLAGLLAACAFQDAQVFEAGARGIKRHKALLRFRSAAVGDAVGIEFRRARVRKGIWHDGRFVQPDIRLANWYARKVVGHMADRSIWNLEFEDRWIAPVEFQEMLVSRCERRITYNYEITLPDIRRLNEPAISTIPIKVLHNLLLAEVPRGLARFPEQRPPTPITVERYLVPGADVHQTIYFPDPKLNLYRASIVGDILIVESVGDKDAQRPLYDAFGMTRGIGEFIDETKQPLGKISPIDEAWRKQFILWASQQHGIYSLGRFATWRNILLDDVLHDISVIRKLIVSHPYDHTLAN